LVETTVALLLFSSVAIGAVGGEKVMKLIGTRCGVKRQSQ
jgi:hypothetical protein